jgi:hypothetical protein
MRRLLKALGLFFILFAIITSANHCALEELISQSDNTSDCCPAEESSHPHGTPCQALTAVQSKSFINIAKAELTPVNFVADFSTNFMNILFQAVESPRIDIPNRVLLTLSTHDLILSPNAPPVV